MKDAMGQTSLELILYKSSWRSIDVCYLISTSLVALLELLRTGVS